MSLHRPTRRELLGGLGGWGAIRALHAAVKPVRITSIDLFAVDVPVSEAEHEAGVQHRSKSPGTVPTDAGISGYSFGGAPVRALAELKTALVGKRYF